MESHTGDSQCHQDYSLTCAVFLTDYYCLSNLTLPFCPVLVPYPSFLLYPLLSSSPPKCNQDQLCHRSYLLSYLVLQRVCFSLKVGTEQYWGYFREPLQLSAGQCYDLGLGNTCSPRTSTGPADYPSPNRTRSLSEHLPGEEKGRKAKSSVLCPECQ